ncbi:hypothetical protein M752DRAFT_137974 [Aspergillus phoenicis ATCC 13157]|uniref:Uncharacterized protein n=2 Tax=Aspergillus TaxID=5052 RepID=A0A370PQ24_ASPPH|nr:hypothetical protein M747DRAFT_177482 [Aspergillus niger ATCC 13496]RDK44306.1 hypothetical protein M752DRAFT_137974 [Aspergillus phoenicis ATCC 13157]
MGMFPFSTFLILFEGLSHHFPVHVCFSEKKERFLFDFFFLFLFQTHSSPFSYLYGYLMQRERNIVYYSSSTIYLLYSFFSPSALCKK